MGETGLEAWESRIEALHSVARRLEVRWHRRILIHGADKAACLLICTAVFPS